MPISPSELFTSVGLRVRGTVPWGELPDTDDPGVYAISLSPDPRRNDCLLPDAPIDEAKVRAWIKRVPSFCFRGTLRPDPREVAEFLKTFWLCEEGIIYIGKAACLSERLRLYRGHTLGNRSPHAGGHWIKTLSNLDQLFIHFCKCRTAKAAKTKEDRALGLFKSQVSPAQRKRLRNPIPFANRAHPAGNSKQSDICYDVLP